MRKFRFIMMLLLAAVVVVSCDKSDEVISGTNSGKDENANTIVDPDVEEAMRFVGYWTRNAESVQDGVVYGRYFYEFRFYEDGTGHKSIDGFNENGYITSTSYGPFSYAIKNGALYLDWGSKGDPIEVPYKLEGDRFYIFDNYDGEDVTFEFVKTEDVDSKFVGDWNTTFVNEAGKQVVYHYKFITPTYGYAYQSVYDNPNTAPNGTDMLFDFRYEFDDNSICMKVKGVEARGRTITKYYRIAGTKLYLSDKKGGEETMYRNFKQENGL